MAIGAALIGGAVGGLTQGIGSYLSYKGQKSANQTNIRLAQEAREHDLDMWNRQNEYNTPAMQMQRLEDAGLNPRLIYGSGTASTGNAVQAQKAPTPEVQNELASMKALNAAPLIGLYQDWQVKKAQIDNLEAQKDVYTQNAIGQSIANAFQKERQPYFGGLALSESQEKGARSNIARMDAFIRQAERDIIQKYGTDMKKYQLESVKLGNRERRLNIELDEMLKPYGMHRGDQLWQRMLLPIIQNNLGDVRNFRFRDLYKLLKR